MNEVLPQLNELLFSSVEGVVVESVEVIDTVVRAEIAAAAADLPGDTALDGELVVWENHQLAFERLQ
ncbi:hypothetical protein ABT009_24735 [Streptomyces sp. NPDC002896]|uniref:hypothetical protein n=1 Tax=Streptomyces sp. NPDC002896 TaxID=3154438 RepID=UPI00331CEE22